MLREAGNCLIWAPGLDPEQGWKRFLTCIVSLVRRGLLAGNFLERFSASLRPFLMNIFDRGQNNGRLTSPKQAQGKHQRRWQNQKKNHLATKKERIFFFFAEAEINLARTTCPSIRTITMEDEEGGGKAEVVMEKMKDKHI